MADSAAGSVAGQKRGVAVEQPGGLLATLIGDTSVTQRWLVCILLLFLMANYCTSQNNFYVLEILNNKIPSDCIGSL